MFQMYRTDHINMYQGELSRPCGNRCEQEDEDTLDGESMEDHQYGGELDPITPSLVHILHHSL